MGIPPVDRPLDGDEVPKPSVPKRYLLDQEPQRSPSLGAMLPRRGHICASRAPAVTLRILMRMLLVAALVLAAPLAMAAEVELLFFHIAGCSQCAPMKAFLDALSARYPELRVVSYEVGLSPGNWRLMMRLAEAYGLDDVEVPVVFVGDLGVAGPGAANELLIEEEVQRCIASGCPSPEERVGRRGGWFFTLSPLEAAVVVLFLAWALYVLFQG